ncbi:MAG: hypothetical protein PSV35_01605 [bacterium]|nr:hypothetical protein [bacterium]
MAKVFIDIQNADCCFPDAKLTNWLVDGQGKIRLADTKSFLFTQDGTFSKAIPGNENVYTLHTPGFEPSEIINPSFNAEKLHSSLLGRNIYAYLTGGWPNVINPNLPIFETDLGKEYKTLITNLIKDPPEKRMSLSAAYSTLQELALRSLFIEKISELNQSAGVVTTDLKLNERFEDTLLLIQQISSIEINSQSSVSQKKYMILSVMQ